LVRALDLVRALALVHALALVRALEYESGVFAFLTPTGGARSS
jgi:hypothetical protein